MTNGLDQPFSEDARTIQERLSELVGRNNVKVEYSYGIYGGESATVYVKGEQGITAISIGQEQNLTWDEIEDGREWNKPSPYRLG
jgi:hypothetical protein